MAASLWPSLAKGKHRQIIIEIRSKYRKEHDYRDLKLI